MRRNHALTIANTIHGAGQFEGYLYPERKDSTDRRDSRGRGLLRTDSPRDLRGPARQIRHPRLWRVLIGSTRKGRFQPTAAAARPFCCRGTLVSESGAFVRMDQTPGPRSGAMPAMPPGQSQGSRPRPDFHNAPVSRYTAFHKSGVRSSSHHEPCSTAGGISRDDKHNDSATFRRRIRHCVPYIRTISSPEDIPSGPQRARSLERDGRRSRLRSHA